VVTVGRRKCAELLGTADVATADPAHFGTYLHRLNSGQVLTYHEAANYMRMVLAIADDRQRSAQLGVLLNGFMAKHPTVDEAVGVIDAALELDVHRPADRPAHPFTGERVIGIAGSGKKGVKMPNISTPAAIVAAAAGIKIAKCASSATSSVAGSADTLKSLGVQLSADTGRTLDVMDRCGLGVFEIEQMVPRFDAAYGGLFFAPHVLSLASLVTIRSLPDRQAALKLLRGLPAGAYIYSHPMFGGTVFDADLAAAAITNGILPAGGKLAKVTLDGLTRVHQATSGAFRAWDGSSRRIRESLAAGAAGIVATPLCAFSDPLPVKDSGLLQAAIDPLQATLDALPDRPARTVLLLAQAQLS